MKANKIVTGYFVLNGLFFTFLGLGNIFLEKGENPFCPGIDTDTVATILLFFIAGICWFAVIVTRFLNK